MRSCLTWLNPADAGGLIQLNLGYAIAYDRFGIGEVKRRAFA
jgi:hypothetical protein